MAYIITRLCRDCVDTGCVAVCPVDCIYKKIEHPSPEQVVQNKEKWGWTG